MIEVSTEYPQDVIRRFVGERIGVEPDLLMPSTGSSGAEAWGSDRGRSFP